MPTFKLNSKGIKAVGSLKASQSFSTFVKLLQEELALLDKNNRILTDPHQLIKETGKAQMLSEVLDSIAKV